MERFMNVFLFLANHKKSNHKSVHNILKRFSPINTLKVLQTYYNSIHLTLYRSFVLFLAGKMDSKRKLAILMIANEQGKIFKEFKTDNKFTNAVSAFKISKTTINYKIDSVKFIDMYPKMQTSCISLYYLKNDFRVIKEVCQEHTSEFQQYVFDKHFDYFKVKKKDCFGLL